MTTATPGPTGTTIPGGQETVGIEPTITVSMTLVPTATVPTATVPTATVPIATVPTTTLEVQLSSADDLPSPIEHTVQAGETLLGLARRYDLPIAAIQLQNDLGGQITLWVGQALTIVPEERWQGASPYWILHRVKAGETLGGIAAQYDVELAELQATNQMGDATIIAIDQLLIIPLQGPAGLAAANPLPTPAPVATAAPAEAAPVVVPAPASSQPGDIAAWRSSLLAYINQVRAEHGLYALAYNDTLSLAAQAHAADCQQRGWCSHTGSDGSSSAIRIQRAGYAAAGTAECWIQTLTPGDAVEWWMDEVPPNDPHRRTLLSQFVSEVGFGVAEAAWGYYIIADFGRPAGG